MNRFNDIAYIASRELLPWESARRNLSVTTGQFELVTGFGFYSDIAGGWIELEAGQVSDLASIPDAAAALFGINTDDQRIAGGAWVHDKIYGAVGKIKVWPKVFSLDTMPVDVQLTRKQADQILCFEAMAQLGASSAKQWTAYQALRRFGNQWPGGSFWERFL